MLYLLKDPLATAEVLSAPLSHQTSDFSDLVKS